MRVQARLRDLRDLLEAFLERPQPGVLVIRCTEEEHFYLIHTLEQLDADSPADRFLVVPEPFSAPATYLDALDRRIMAERGDPSPATSTAPRPEDPSSRLRTILAGLIQDLPPGDHRLMCALAPCAIDDPDGFTALAESLLSDPLPAPLRLVLRESPTHPTTAAEHRSDNIFAYSFHLPATVVVEDTAAVAMDTSRPADERSQAILQMAIRDHGFGRHQRAVHACDLILELAPGPALIVLGLATRAEALRAQGQLPEALASASEALRGAVAAENLPLIHASAMTLGEVSLQSDRVNEALACFTLAEQAAIYSPDAQTIARERLRSLQFHPHADPHPRPSHCLDHLG